MKMEGFKPYEIPSNIQKLEFNKETSFLSDFEALGQKCRQDEISYNAAFTAMIQMEEAANSRGLRDYNLENVEIILHSHADHAFKIRYNVSKEVHIPFRHSP